MKLISHLRKYADKKDFEKAKTCKRSSCFVRDARVNRAMRVCSDSGAARDKNSARCSAVLDDLIAVER